MVATTKFADNGTTVNVLTYDDNHVKSELEAAVYAVNFNPMSGFYLAKRGEKLTSIPSRVYGKTELRVEKIMKSYGLSEKSFGILLSGDKGSGKTMTSSITANRCIDELGIPVILIEQAFEGSGLADFIQQIGECVLFIDEFGKKFHEKEDQNALLGLFDGTSASRRLIILTENDTRHINRYMLDRPGRIHYHFRHEKLDEDTVREFCEDKGIPDSVISQIIFRRDTSFEFSFDVLQAIVSEYLNFGGDINDICEDLNIERPLEFSTKVMKVVSIFDETNGVDRIPYGNTEGLDFPVGANNVHVNYKALGEQGERGRVDGLMFTVKNLISREGSVYKFAGEDDERANIVLTVQVEEKNFGKAY